MRMTTKAKSTSMPIHMMMATTYTRTKPCLRGSTAMSIGMSPYAMCIRMFRMRTTYIRIDCLALMRPSGRTALQEA